MTTKKKTATSNIDIGAEAPPAKAEETWQAHWNVARRLLELRRRLRDSKLWATFELQRTFEAFSIHTMAPQIEQIAGDCGLISSFRVTKWDKLGNRTVVEGMVTFESVDDGEVREYPGIGESIDNGDKGLHKADSDARKVGMINALNLGIGTDKEAADEKADDGPAAKLTGQPQQMSGAPQQTARKASSISGGGDAQLNGNGAAPKKEYDFRQAGAGSRKVDGSQLVHTAWIVVLNAATVSALDAFGEMNQEEFGRFCIDDPAKGMELRKLFDRQRSVLERAGKL